MTSKLRGSQGVTPCSAIYFQIVRIRNSFPTNNCLNDVGAINGIGLMETKVLKCVLLMSEFNEYTFKVLFDLKNQYSKEFILLDVMKENYT